MKSTIKSFVSKIKFYRQRGLLKEDPLSYAIGYCFKSTSLRDKAMTHRSVLKNSDQRIASNERLEYLGDAVLGMVVSDALYKKYPSWEEGQLTKAKSCMVSRHTLAQQAIKMDLGQYLFLSPGEEKSGGRHRRSILSDTFEALLGAVYLDGGLDAAKDFIHRFLFADCEAIIQEGLKKNYKSWLLEYVQSLGKQVPRYRVIHTSGPEHNKVFTIIVSVEGEELGRGMGSTKKRAEQEAAYEALIKLGLIIKKQ